MLLRLLIGAALCGVLARGQESNRGALPKAALSRSARQVLTVSQAIPPEFAADSLLTLVERGLVSEQSAQQRLLERAFVLSALADEQAALRTVDPPGAAVTRALHVLSERGIDRVSLRARTVKVLLRLDPERARELFEQIEAPFKSGFRCEDRFIYDFSSYYDVMRDVAGTLHDPAQAARFLSWNIAHLVSAAQIEPFVRAACRGSRNGPGWLPDVASRLAARLREIDSDPRTFSSDSAGSIAALAELASMVPLDLREQLIRAARAWVLRGLGGGRCGERRQSSFGASGKKITVIPMNAVDGFNQKLAVLSGAKSRILIPPKEIPRPANGAAATPEHYSAEEERFARIESLLTGDRPEAQGGPRWRAELDAYVEFLTHWQSNSQDQTVYYLEKADLLQAALRLDMLQPIAGTVLSLRSNDRMAQIFAQFLDGEAARKVYRTRRALWFAPVLSVMGSYEHSAALDRAFRSSVNPVLRIYGML